MMTRVVTVSCVLDIAGQLLTDALLTDTPGTVVVRHVIDHDGRCFQRTLYSMNGLVERQSIDSTACCLSCTVRDDEVDTVFRLAADGWDVIVIALPTAATPSPFVTQLISEIEARESAITVAAVMAALDPGTIESDLMDDLLLRERGIALGSDDARSVGETIASMIDYSDITWTIDHPDDAACELLTHTAPASTMLWFGLHQLDAATATGFNHDAALAETRLDPVKVDCHSKGIGDETWTIELSSQRPFHPHRLLDQIELLGGGRLRARGCFWLPTRPGRICCWSGAGGQLYIGDSGEWGELTPRTRLLVTGTDHADRARVRRAFKDCLLTGYEVQLSKWPAADGLEPWLG